MRAPAASALCHEFVEALKHSLKRIFLMRQPSAIGPVPKSDHVLFGAAAATWASQSGSQLM